MATGYKLLLLLGALTACGEIMPPFTDAGPEADGPIETDAAPPDAPDVDAPIDAIEVDAAPGTWAISRVTGDVNSTMADAYPSATSDHRELYFVRPSPVGGGMPVIFVARRSSTGAAWGTPEPAASVPGALGPEVSPNGLELYFARLVNGQLFGGVYRRGSTSEAWPQSPVTAWAPGAGGIALTGDALTAYYADTSGHVRMRRRANVATDWGIEEMVPGAVDVMRYRYVTVSADALVMVVSGPVASFDPPVRILSRADVGAVFANVTSPDELTDKPDLTACDMWGPSDAMYCHRDDGDGNAEIYLVTKAGG